MAGAVWGTEEEGGAGALMEAGAPAGGTGTSWAPSGPVQTAPTITTAAARVRAIEGKWFMCTCPAAGVVRAIAPERHHARKWRRAQSGNRVRYNHRTPSRPSDMAPKHHHRESRSRPASSAGRATLSDRQAARRMQEMETAVFVDLLWRRDSTLMRLARAHGDVLMRCVRDDKIPDAKRWALVLHVMEQGASLTAPSLWRSHHSDTKALDNTPLGCGVDRDDPTFVTVVLGRRWSALHSQALGRAVAGRHVAAAEALWGLRPPQTALAGLDLTDAVWSGDWGDRLLRAGARPAQPIVHCAALWTTPNRAGKDVPMAHAVAVLERIGARCHPNAIRRPGEKRRAAVDWLSVVDGLLRDAEPDFEGARKLARAHDLEWTDVLRTAVAAMSDGSHALMWRETTREAAERRERWIVFLTRVAEKIAPNRWSAAFETASEREIPLIASVLRLEALETVWPFLVATLDAGCPAAQWLKQVSRALAPSGYGIGSRANDTARLFFESRLTAERDRRDLTRTVERSNAAPGAIAPPPPPASMRRRM